MKKIEVEIEEIVREFRKNKRFWVLQDLAEFLEISKRTAWNMVRRGDIQAVKVKGEWKIHRKWVIEYLKKNHADNID